MNNIKFVTLVGLLGSALATNVTFAQKPADVADLSEVTISASRMNVKPIVSKTGWPRAPVTHVTLTYFVSIVGHDLTSSTGVADVETMVDKAAMDLCKELGQQYPGSTPDDAGCAKEAADKAMVQVRQLAAAARKAPAK